MQDVCGELVVVATTLEYRSMVDVLLTVTPDDIVVPEDSVELQPTPLMMTISMMAIIPT